MASSLVFVEGMSASGKTTMSQHIAGAMREHGRECDLCHEEKRHAIGMHYNPDEYESVQDYLSLSASRWASFATGASKSDEVTVMDGRLLQGPIFGLLLRDIDRQTITGHVRDLVNAVMALRPVLVYLHRPDYVEGFRTLCDTRGTHNVGIYVERIDQSPFAESRGVKGIQGLRQFWQEHRELQELLIAGFDMPTLMIDVTECRWDAYNARTMEFLFDADDLRRASGL